MGNFVLQKRKFSSNIIEIKKGKSVIPYIAPLSLKEDGDQVAYELIEFLNDPNRTTVIIEQNLEWFKN